MKRPNSSRSRGLRLVLPIGLFVAALLSLTLVEARASAQSPLQQLLDLNRQAMEAYNNLELDQAQQLLDQALETARRNRITGPPLARTLVNLGVVAIGGFGDNGRGMSFFADAIRQDSSVALDPLTSTPDIQTVFNLARQRAGVSDGGGQQGGGQQGGGQQGGGQQGGGAQGPQGTLPHQAIPEQLVQTAVPVYVEVPGNPAHVYLYFQGHGMREYRRVEMDSVGVGFGYEIPCADVFAPEMRYYIVAFARDGSPLGFAGTQSAPVTVSIVSSRTQPPPALPGRSPPQQCAEQECPPGMDGCGSMRSGPGGHCGSDADCRSGLSCEDSICTGEDGGGGGGGGGEGSAAPHLIFQLGYTNGLGLANPGMQADSFPDDPDVMRPADAYVQSGTGDCELGDPELYCVRVSTGGLVYSPALRLAVGFYIPGVDWLGFAAFVRFAPIAGVGTLSNVLIGGRAQFRLTTDMENANGGAGLSAVAHVGVSGGQIQISPPGNGDNAPYIISGLTGLQVGGTVSYRFIKEFGLFVQPELMFQFPTFMFNIDLNLGVEVAFL